MYLNIAPNARKELRAVSLLYDLIPFLPHKGSFMNTKNLSVKIVALSLLMLGAAQKVVARVTFNQMRESEKMAEQIIKEFLDERCKKLGHGGCNKEVLANTILENLRFGREPFVVDRDFDEKK